MAAGDGGGAGLHPEVVAATGLVFRLLHSSREFAAASPGARFQLWTLVFLALITIHDWRSADPTATLVALVLVPGLLAYSEPRRRWSIGLLFGCWLLLAHLAADLSASLRPHYQRFPLSSAEILEIALICAVTVPAALLGASARRPSRGA